MTGSGEEGKPESQDYSQETMFYIHLKPRTFISTEDPGKEITSKMD